MQVCAAEWRASERSGDDRSRRPFEYSGPADQSRCGRRTEGQPGERPVLRVVPKQIVNRRVRDGRCKEPGESACDVPDGAATGSVGVLLRAKRAAKRALPGTPQVGFRKARAQ